VTRRRDPKPIDPAKKLVSVTICVQAATYDALCARARFEGNSVSAAARRAITATLRPAPPKSE
jgi:hypothetical protein